MRCSTIILERSIYLQMSKDKLVPASTDGRHLLPITYDEAIALRDDLIYCIDMLKPKTLKQSLYPDLGDV